MDAVLRERLSRGHCMEQSFLCVHCSKDFQKVKMGAVAICGLAQHFDFRLLVFFQAFFRDRDAAVFVGAGDFKHHVEHGVFDDAFEASGAGLALDCFFGDGAESGFFEDEFHVVHGEELFVLLDGRVLRLGEDAQEVVLGERFECADDGQAPDDFGDDAVLHEVFGTHFVYEFIEALGRVLFLAFDWRAEADARRIFFEPLGNDVFDADESAADDE